MFSISKMPYYLGKKGLLQWLPDKVYLKIVFRSLVGYPLNLKEPKTFNEKMQWLKLHDRNPEYVKMVDKYEAKQYVSDIVGESYIIPTLGVWNSFDEIDFDKLPDRFVLKCTHDSGGLAICKNKKTFNIDEAKKKINASLRSNYYWAGKEWPYSQVPPRIIAEAYMEDTEGKGNLTDYKVHCYNGEPKAVQVISNRYGTLGMRNDYYTLDWKNYGLRRGKYKNSDHEAEKPAEFDELIELSRKLSKGAPFMRVDFYIVNHKLYFGELTLYPASGFNPFVPESFDQLFGEWINLPRD